MKSTCLKLFISALFCLAVSAAANASGGTTITGPNPLPQTAPAPNIVYRESFGAADLARPTGGKGTLKDVYAHTNLRSFWIEYPGNKNTQWIASDVGPTWRYCGGSDNPYEMFSPIQITLGMMMNGCAASEWFEVPTVNPVALMPVTLPSTTYEISVEGYPAPIDGKYIAIGLTNSGSLYDNFGTSAAAVLVCRPVSNNGFRTARFELYGGGMNGAPLATVDSYFDGWNRLKLRYDPVNKRVSASGNEIDLGTFPLNIGAPKFAGFEGVGIIDDFVIRQP